MEDDELLDDAALNAALGIGSSGRSKRRREKAKAKKDAPPIAPAVPGGRSTTSAATTTTLPPGVSIEYAEVSADSVLGGVGGTSDDPVVLGLLAAFRRAQGLPAEGGEEEGLLPPEAPSSSSGAGGGDGGGDGEEDGEHGGGQGGALAHLPGGLTRRERRKLLQDFVTVMKGQVANPEVVEAHDVTSPDPYLLVHLKTLKGTVPVPRHWCHQKRYLQGKVRATPRPAYELPEYVAATGIGTLRDLDNEANDKKTLKSKTRERVRPKMGRIEVDYFVLRDAFFVHQTKPRLTGFGELYYEGKEFEKDKGWAKVGVLSERLREALGMRQQGQGGGEAHSPLIPPPWLHAQQRFGPPPSYPTLKIPGVSAPIPPGASFGSGQGQWGYPPTNELGIPLYGDVFGLGGGGGRNGSGSGSGGGGGGAGGLTQAGDAAAESLRVGGHWGEIREGGGIGMGGGGGGTTKSAASAAAAAEASTLVDAPKVEEEERMSAAAAAAAAATAAAASLEAASAAAVSASAATATLMAAMGSSSSASLAPPSAMELRKGAAPSTKEEAAGPLYTVLAEATTALSGSLLASKAKYIVPGGGGGAGGAGGGGGVILELQPEELAKLSQAELAARYEAAAAAERSRGGAATDIAELMEEQEKKRKRKEGGGGGEGGAKKKGKKEDYKF